MIIAHIICPFLRNVNVIKVVWYSNQSNLIIDLHSRVYITFQICVVVYFFKLGKKKCWLTFLNVITCKSINNYTIVQHDSTILVPMHRTHKRLASAEIKSKSETSTAVIQPLLNQGVSLSLYCCVDWWLKFLQVTH